MAKKKKATFIHSANWFNRIAKIEGLGTGWQIRGWKGKLVGCPTQTIYHVVQYTRWTSLVREYETDCFPKLDLFDLYWLFCLFYLSFSLHCGGWEKYETFAKLYLFGFWGLLLLFIMLCNMQDGHCWCGNMKRIACIAVVGLPADRGLR